MALPIMGGLLVLTWRNRESSPVTPPQSSVRPTQSRSKNRQLDSPYQNSAIARLRAGEPESLAALLKDWQENDPAALENWLHEVIRSSPAQAETLLIALSRADLSALALEQVASLPTSLQASCVDSIFVTISSTAPLDAWGLASGLESEELKELARHTILTKGSDTQLPELANLALTSDATSIRDEALGSVLSRWTLQDPAAVTVWLNDHPQPSSVQDNIALQLVFQCDGLNRSAETAMAWADSISDGGQRYQAIATASRELAIDNPESAREAIQRSENLTGEEKLFLLSNLSRPPPETAFPPAD